jgi:hypothetical protein
MEARVQRGKKEEKEMEMLVARRKVEKKAVRETENKRVEQEENEMVEEKRVEDGEKRMGVLVVDEGVEEENAVDGWSEKRKERRGVAGEEDGCRGNGGDAEEDSGREVEESLGKVVAVRVVWIRGGISLVRTRWW